MGKTHDDGDYQQAIHRGRFRYVERIGKERAEKLDALYPSALDLFIPPPPSVSELLQATEV